MTQGKPLTSSPPLRVIDLGRIGYGPALAEQRRINQAVIDGREPPTLLLLEHDPVITVSHRKSAPHNMLASSARLAQLGIAVHETDRGGDITYHGPGQLVAYPILPLAPLGLNLGRYMRLLEQVVIDTVARFGVEGLREPGATGVWVRVTAPRGSGGLASDEAKVTLAKLCALGVRVRKNTTMHGLALNVTTDLSHFQTIVPCGLPDRGVTSLQMLLGDQTPDMAEVKRTLAEVMCESLEPLAA